MEYSCIIAEDDTLITRTLILYASKLDLRIIGSVKSGSALIELVHKETPDIIFVDIKLDRMDGLAACQNIVKEGFHSRIIIISGSVDPTHLLIGIKLGTVDYVQKPFTFGDFEAAVQKAKKSIDDMRLLNEVRRREKKFVSVKNKYRDVDIEEHDIVYVEKLEKRQFLIFFVDGTTLITGTNLHQIQEQCSEAIFFPHKSFLANIHHIRNVIPNEEVGGNYDISFAQTDKIIPLTRRNYHHYLHIKQRLIRHEI